MQFGFSILMGFGGCELQIYFILTSFRLMVFFSHTDVPLPVGDFLNVLLLEFIVEFVHAYNCAQTEAIP